MLAVCHCEMELAVCDPSAISPIITGMMMRRMCWLSGCLVVCLLVFGSLRCSKHLQEKEEEQLIQKEAEHDDGRGSEDNKVTEPGGDDRI